MCSHDITKAKNRQRLQVHCTCACRLSLNYLYLHVSNLDAHQQEVDFADNDITQMVPGTIENILLNKISSNKHISLQLQPLSHYQPQSLFSRRPIYHSYSRMGQAPKMHSYLLAYLNDTVYLLGLVVFKLDV